MNLCKLIYVFESLDDVHCNLDSDSEEEISEAEKRKCRYVVESVAEICIVKFDHNSLHFLLTQTMN